MVQLFFCLNFFKKIINFEEFVIRWSQKPFSAGQNLHRNSQYPTFTFTSKTWFQSLLWLYCVCVCVCANLNQFLQPAQRGFLISMLRVRAARWSPTWAGWASFTKECSSEKLHDRNRNRFYCRRRGLGVDLLARYAAQCLLFEASEFLPFWSGF